jgi:[acyl-carrier-protein] S-malonyltransferase
MKNACIFPGQGAQKIGMGLEFYKNFKSARDVFDEADDTLNENLSKVIFEGPEDKLTLTENTQVALMVTSIAILRVLEEKFGKKLKHFCDYVAGHSLGEFTGLVANNSLKFADCVKLLRLRGKAMQQAVPAGIGAMFALVGADIKISKEIAIDSGVEVANDNSPSQQVLSGETSRIQKAMELTESRGYKAIKLNVSGPFHSRLMEPAKKILEEALEVVNLNAPETQIISNFTGEVMQLEDIKSNLLFQLTNTVRWCDSIMKLKSLGVENFLEVGPGKIYTNLTKRIDPTLNALALNDEASINLFVESLSAKAL